jgi:hypothetical protein
MRRGKGALVETALADRAALVIALDVEIQEGSRPHCGDHG